MLLTRLPVNTYIRGKGAHAFFLASVVALTIAPLALHAQTQTVLYSFTDVNGDGLEPAAGLIMDSKGNLYGTTSAGGLSNCAPSLAPAGCGTVFKISNSGIETVLYAFTDTSGDGANPIGGLVMDSSGNLYGTTIFGGSSANCPATPYSVAGCGTVFKLDPTGHETILHSFSGSAGSDGANPPNGGLTFDAAGNLYGVTIAGGSSANCTGGCGIVFKIDTAGTYSIFHTFTNAGPDGGNPSGALFIDTAGNLYGATRNSPAIANYCLGGGCGTIYKLAPNGSETVLFTFGNLSPNPNVPFAGVIMDGAGNLYGTTTNGGMFNDGTVFKLTPSGTLTTLHSFVLSANGADGAVPFAELVMDKKGDIYGTTTEGGTCSGAFAPGGCGVVFKITKAGTETVFHDFLGLDGIRPTAGLIIDKKGNFYGTTTAGGSLLFTSCSCGTVFKITPH